MTREQLYFEKEIIMKQTIVYIESICLFFLPRVNYNTSYLYYNIISWPETCSTERFPLFTTQILAKARERSLSLSLTPSLSLCAENTSGISRHKYDAATTEDLVVACNELVSIWHFFFRCTQRFEKKLLFNLLDRQKCLYVIGAIISFANESAVNFWLRTNMGQIKLPWTTFHLFI